MKSSPLREAIFLNTAALGQSYQLVADLMQARVQAKGAEDPALAIWSRSLPPRGKTARKRSWCWKISLINCRAWLPRSNKPRRRLHGEKMERANSARSVL
jgi:hypothetical protein